jgi:hypothetical protein
MVFSLNFANFNEDKPKFNHAQFYSFSNNYFRIQYIYDAKS